jgi:hypothetical protein
MLSVHALSSGARVGIIPAIPGGYTPDFPDTQWGDKVWSSIFALNPVTVIGFTSPLNPLSTRGEGTCPRGVLPAVFGEGAGG